MSMDGLGDCASREGRLLDERLGVCRLGLHDVLARTRLYGALDQACARPVAWLCAQPGARVSAVEADAVGDAESGAVGGDGEAVSGVEVGV